MDDKERLKEIMEKTHHAIELLSKLLHHPVNEPLRTDEDTFEHKQKLTMFRSKLLELLNSLKRIYVEAQHIVENWDDSAIVTMISIKGKNVHDLSFKLKSKFEEAKQTLRNLKAEESKLLGAGRVPPIKSEKTGQLRTTDLVKLFKNIASAPDNGEMYRGRPAKFIHKGRKIVFFILNVNPDPLHTTVDLALTIRSKVKRIVDKQSVANFSNIPVNNPETVIPERIEHLKDLYITRIHQSTNQNERDELTAKLIRSGIIHNDDETKTPDHPKVSKLNNVLAEIETKKNNVESAPLVSGSSYKEVIDDLATVIHQLVHTQLPGTNHEELIEKARALVEQMIDRIQHDDPGRIPPKLRYLKKRFDTTTP